MKKRMISALLCAAVLFSGSVFSVGAQITYYDDFDDGTKGDFWGEIGNFVIENGAMTGYSDAVVAQSQFTNYPGSPLYQSGVGTLKEFTVWVDVKIDRDAPDANAYGAGLWICDPTDQAAGRAGDRDVYKLFYYAKDGVRTSFARFSVESPRNTASTVSSAMMDVDGDPGFNISGAPVKLGLMCRQGLLVAFANGKTVGTYSYSTIGTSYTPILFWNTNCYVEFDNFCVGDLSEDVAARTRPGTASNTAHSVTVESGVSLVSSAYEGNAVTVCANDPASGMTFAGWEVVSGDAALADPFAPVTAFAMPGNDVRLRATYKSGSSSGTAMNPTYLTFANSSDFNAVVSSTYNECTRAIENGELKLTAQNVGSSNSYGLPDPYAQIRYTKLTKKIYAEDYKYLTIVYRVPETNSRTSYDTEVFFNTQNRSARAGQSVTGSTAVTGERYRYLTLNASGLSEWEGVITSVRLDFFSRAANDDVMYVHNILFSKTAAEARLQANAVVSALNIPSETTLTFNMCSHGEQVPPQTLGKGQLPTRPADPAAEGYVFDNWYTSRSDSKLFDFGVPLTGDATAYARWIRLCTVTFECGSGVEAPAAQTVPAGSHAERPADPVREGYTFAGWYTTSACTQEFSFATDIRSSRTVYAKWEKAIDPTASTVVVRAPRIEVPEGASRVEVPIAVTGCPEGGLSSVLFTTRVVGASIVAGAPGADLPDSSNGVVGPTANSAKNGVKFMWVSFSDAITGDTDVVTFTVELPASAAEGDTFEIVVTPSENPEDFLSDDGETAYGASGENGSITVIANTAVVECVAAIDAIGTVTLASGAAIAAAEAKYAALRVNERAAVTNYDTLTAARAAYDALVEASDTPKLALTSASAQAGGQFSVTLSLENNPGVSAMIVVLDYDRDALTLDSVTNAGNFSGFTKELELGRFVFDENEDVAGDVLLMTLTFTVKQGAPDGGYRIAASVENASNYDLDDVYFAPAAAVVSVGSAITYGDANGDGEISTKDVIILRRYLANYDGETGTSNIDVGPGADANGDGEISTKDVILLRRYLANYDMDTGTSTIPLGPQN